LSPGKKKASPELGVKKKQVARYQALLSGLQSTFAALMLSGIMIAFALTYL
jgi:hypothetical protein